MNIPFSVFTVREWMTKIGRLVLAPWLRQFQLSTEDIKRVEDLADHGLVVYVMRSASILDIAFLSAILVRHRLPAVAWTNTRGPWTVRTPAGTNFKESGAGLLFLRAGGGIVTSRFLSLEAKLESLTEWCRHEGHKVFLVPVVSIWQRRPLTLETSLLDILFGPVEHPGILRRLYWLLRYAKEIRVSMAKEIDLTEFACSRKDFDARGVARRIRLSIARHFAGEEHSVVGPRLKKREQMLRLVVKDPVVQKTIEELAESTGLPRTTLEETALKDANEIAANYDIKAIRFLEFLLSRVLAIIFSGMYVDLRGLKRFRELSRKGPILLLPSHKSHIDYLLLSYIFKINGLPPPHIAAGINLAFFPMGTLFRRSGAFFLRRSFAGDTIYKVVFQTYIKLLLREGFNIEFFIEGTRSRAGRIMPPRFGMLQMITEALQTGTAPEVTCLPIGIDYELLVEQKSIEQELSGKEKQPENLGTLISARKKLRSTFGSCYLNFGEEFSLNEWLQRHSDFPLKEQVERLGYQVVKDIAATGTVTESAILATALCIHHKRGIEADSLDRKMLFLRTLLQDKQVRLAESFPYAGNRFQEVLRLYLQKGLLEKVSLHDEEIFMIPDNRRLILDYYKNNLLHHLAPLSVAAWAFHSCEEDSRSGYDISELFDRYSYLWGLIGEQFNRRFIPPSMIEFREQAAVFEKWQWIEKISGAGFRIKAIKPLRALENLTINYYESIYVVSLTLMEAEEQAYTQKVWTRNCLEMANLLYAKGDIWRFESRSKANLESTLKEFMGFGWLVPVGSASKRRKEAQQFSVDPAHRPLVNTNLQAISCLILERKPFSS